MWYAQNPGRRTRQLAGDAAVLLWTALWTAAALVAYRLAVLLSHPGPDSGVASSWSPATRLPVVGDDVDAALRSVVGFVDAVDPVTLRATLAVAAASLFLLPIGLVLAVWLPRRVRWVRQAAAARELAAFANGRELLALRALLRPLDEVAATAAALPDATPGSLAEGWRTADPRTLDALADAELERLGLAPGPEPLGPLVAEPAG
ncbi:hypothetical protein AB0I84_18690 [Streptomyces spectabilis]|uniref:Uncharacterized protein n=1 Tax=Streptomyces spectabilis TaxID=68270 RepID=A0A5P2XBY9_STRST|nr:hypothetical protein [Streptomyces spectabilis]MBB5109070.1 hypothetical protein [Streptomyces spectabilis]MCI3902713.1 hypothetical protein [Streptomyces spectabilis]QEV60016.1 hypothetical protein CP982_15785 [Streptomyces spectabilis]GGV44532.1 hypothetical protein GCM10010245_69660 [Streptomyces spectabilis]